jgi:predicted ribosome quality control (RQC) complex YloA/Tae2 family protein
MSSSSRGGASRRLEEPKLHEYELPSGWRVLAGRSEADNDRLSLRLARPEDWWFHVRGQSGSHVVLQGPPGARPDRETLRVAAAIAAWHSKARGGGQVAVSCTQARFVAKPRGARPGTVQIRRETVLRVRPGLPAQPGSAPAPPGAAPAMPPDAGCAPQPPS